MNGVRKPLVAEIETKVPKLILIPNYFLFAKEFMKITRKAFRKERKRFKTMFIHKILK